MAIGVKNSAVKGNIYTLERKKNTPTKTSGKHNNKADVSDNNHAQNQVSDKLEISKHAKAAYKHSSNMQAGSGSQNDPNLPSQPAQTAQAAQAAQTTQATQSEQTTQIAQTSQTTQSAQTTQTSQAAQAAQNDAHTNAQKLAEQLLATSGGNNIQAIIEEIMAANENALQAMFKDFLAANETSIQSLLEQLVGTGESSHILDFLATVNAPDRNNNDDNSGSNIDDPTRRLTRRLVSARTTHEIHHILSEATKSLGDAILAAANGDEEAQQVVRRLTRLVRRAQRKIGDLNSEEQLRQQEVRAKERELEELARQLELELRQKIAERERRERGWLRNLDDEENNILPLPGTLSGGSLTAAQIKAMAWQAAKAAISMQAAAPASIGSFGGGSVGGGMGAEASLSGGASAGAEAAPDGDAA